MPQGPPSTRIADLDIVRGMIMVLMALDHVRDYFHFSLGYFSPDDPLASTLPIFFTRWITHFCAPGFFLLAGISAFLLGQKSGKSLVSRFLLTRGLWLIFLEVFVFSFAWQFDWQYRSILLQVIWALGFSMLLLSAAVWLPQNLILTASVVILTGHNLLDAVAPSHIFLKDFWQKSGVFTGFGRQWLLAYPPIPWLAIMLLGYALGPLYQLHPTVRFQKLMLLALLFLGMFAILRGFRLYGDPTEWQNYPQIKSLIIQFLNPSKYPPSLHYSLMTLGGIFLALGFSSRIHPVVAAVFEVFGRVPFFFYLLHLYLIHFLAMLWAEWSGWGWQKFWGMNWLEGNEALKGYGLGLAGVYVVWLLVLLILYFPCRSFSAYKHTHKTNKWLSYL